MLQWEKMKDAARGKHKGCCRAQKRWERTENITELVKPQQANEGLSAEACVSLSLEMKTPPVPASQRMQAHRGKKNYSPLYKETFKRLLSKTDT